MTGKDLAEVVSVGSKGEKGTDGRSDAYFAETKAEEITVTCYQGH